VHVAKGYEQDNITHVVVLNSLLCNKTSIIVNIGYSRGGEIRTHLASPSRWWPSDKSLGPRGLLSLWSQIRAMWLLI